jgi:Serine dehydrogenase proteinase
MHARLSDLGHHRARTRTDVSTDMPDVVLELMKLYPQPVRTQSGGGVEYLPIPRQKEPRRGQFFDRSRDGHAR